MTSLLTGRTQDSFCIFISVTAETHKNSGNNAFRKDDFVTAINLYTEGIEVKCNDEDLNAKLYNNRASAHYHLGKVSFISTQSINIALNLCAVIGSIYACIFRQYIFRCIRKESYKILTILLSLVTKLSLYSIKCIVVLDLKKPRAYARFTYKVDAAHSVKI